MWYRNLTTEHMLLPHPRLYRVEWQRALIEASMLAHPESLALLATAPAGDGHPVLVIPGFTAGDHSTWILRYWLRRMGYAASGWQQGINYGVRRDLVDGTQKQMRRLAEDGGTTISLVGHSLGGIYAREMAKREPELVRQVICLGSPIGDPEGKRSHVTRLYEAFNPDHVDKPHQFEKMHWLLPDAPPAPMTAVYSRGDGVVHWQSCIQNHGHECCENVEVFGSHTGLIVNATVLYLIADRLAQVEARWRAFAPPAAVRWLYPV
jgi:pimeloyl-ACP methyl ester carboxylesterase